MFMLYPIKAYYKYLLYQWFPRPILVEEIRGYVKKLFSEKVVVQTFIVLGF